MKKSISAVAIAMALSLPVSADEFTNNLIPETQASSASHLPTLDYSDWSLGISYANDFSDTGTLLSADIRKNLGNHLYTTFSGGKISFQGGNWYLSPVDHPDCQGYYSADGGLEISYECGDQYDSENRYSTSTGFVMQSIGWESGKGQGVSWYGSVGLGIAFSPDDNRKDPYNPIDDYELAQLELGVTYRPGDHYRLSAGVRHISTIRDFGDGIDAFSVQAAYEF